jgi:PHD/YefM family antitoxin component YafN of YafNO toxin-antitoxin module
MDAKKDIRPVTYLKSHAASLLSQINESQRPVYITQKGETRAVLQDPKSYEQMRSAIGLLKLIALGEEDVRSDNVKSQDQVFADLETRLRQRIESCE